MPTTLDLTTLNLPEGTHTINVVAKGDNLLDSEFSNDVSYQSVLSVSEST